MGGHPPVNYHAYAACTYGSFHREIVRLPAGKQPVVLLLRRDLKLCLKALKFVKESGRKVAVALKEAGAHQVAELLSAPKRVELFREICRTADCCIASTQELVPLYLGAGAQRAEFIPTPYPIDDSRWDYSTPPDERQGIFLGTREFDVPSRNHVAALLAVRQLGEPVTVVNVDGRAGLRMLSSIGFRPGQLRIQEKRLAYPEYLKLIARHKFVFQLDRSAVPGQVAGDALLCRIPCIGGDGAIERVAFPDLSGFARTTGELLERAELLLRSPRAYAAAVEESQKAAMRKLSFAAVASNLKAVFTSGGVF